MGEERPADRRPHLHFALALPARSVCPAGLHEIEERLLAHDLQERPALHRCVPPVADAEVVFRTVGNVDGLRESLLALEPLVTWEEMVEVPPVTMTTVPGFDTAAFAYTTDIPFLDRWGQPLLLGAGSILVAHSDHEHVRIADLHRAADQYVELAQYLMKT